MSLPWRRWWFRILLGILASLAVMVIHVLWQRHEAYQELQQVIAELDQADPDWRLERIEAKRRVVPDEENGALIIVEAHRALPKDWTSKVRKAQDEMDKTPPPVRLSDDVARQLKEDLEEVKPAISKARALINYPHGRFAVKYADDYVSTLVIDRQNTRPIVNLLFLDSWKSASENDPAQACSSALAMFHAGLSFHDEPLLISQLTTKPLPLSGNSYRLTPPPVRIKAVDSSIYGQIDACRS